MGNSHQLGHIKGFQQSKLCVTLSPCVLTFIRYRQGAGDSSTEEKNSLIFPAPKSVLEEPFESSQIKYLMAFVVSLRKYYCGARSLSVNLCCGF